jgi:hypothetical protein
LWRIRAQIYRQNVTIKILTCQGTLLWEILLGLCGKEGKELTQRALMRRRGRREE